MTGTYCWLGTVAAGLLLLLLLFPGVRCLLELPPRASPHAT